LLVCTTDEECERTGYFCRERIKRGEIGTVDVCIGG
jgi:hypothetical protein